MFHVEHSCKSIFLRAVLQRKSYRVGRFGVWQGRVARHTLSDVFGPSEEPRVSSHLSHQDDPILLMPGVLIAAMSLAAWVGRRRLTAWRPFGIAESESLMNLSAQGSLQCSCEPTDAAAPFNDRRRSCRACGCVMVSNDPARLYDPMSSEEIEELTRSLRVQGIEQAKHMADAETSEFAQSHASTRVF
jgi:hypothetical protein